MDKREIVLAALSSSSAQTFQPVQVQKLFFLIDKKLGRKVGGPHFRFTAYHYGPFDRNVYDVLELLEAEGLVSIDVSPGFQQKTYTLTEKGRKQGNLLLQGLNERVRQYIGELADFVTSLPFEQLVSAIYRAYPKMAKNSIFRG